MAYIPIQTQLSRGQGRKLMQGGSIALKKSQIGMGQHELHLTRQQVQQLHKAMKGGKIRFSNAQIKYNIKHGKGVWDWVKKGANAAWSGVKHGARWVYDQAKPLVKPILKKGARLATKAVGSAAESALNFAVPSLGTIAAPQINKLTDKGNEKIDELIGDGMRMRGRGPYTPGRGLSTPGRGLYMPGKGMYMPGRGLSMVPSIQLPPPIRPVNSMVTGY